MDKKTIIDIAFDSIVRRTNSIDEVSTINRGSYNLPLTPGVKYFKKNELAPYEIQVSKYDSADLAFDSYDGSLDVSKSKANKIEKISKKISKYLKKHPNSTSSDEDDIIIEATSNDVSSGEYSGPLEIGLKKWNKTSLSPFDVIVKNELNKISKQKQLKNNHKKVVGVWEKGVDGTYDVPTYDVNTISEDLSVWFGTKTKPKGSSQPKGPWVNICKKVDGKHPPCGRNQATDKAYPKCRAAGVAGKMSDSQKRSACSQKRKAEKSHPKTGTGNSPKMVSYHPRKK